LGNANALRTTLQIVAEHQNANWESRIVIALIAGEGPNQPQVDILFKFVGGSYQVSMTKWNGLMPIRVAVSQLAELNVPTKLSIDWKESGDVNIQLGDGPMSTAHLVAPIQKLSISTSSTEIKFSPFLLAHIK